MAAREIHVPFGPDKTGGMGFVPPDEDAGREDEPIDPFAEPAQGKYALSGAPRVDVASDDPAEGGRRIAVASPDSGSSSSPARPVDVPAVPTGEGQPDEPSEEERADQGPDEMQMSFAALRDSVGQGRELKAREKEVREFEEQLATDREELADREDILANYRAIVAEQDEIIARHTHERDRQKAELAQVATELEEAADRLEGMKEYHRTEMQPLETELGRVRANADLAKNDERSRKSELSAAESELRRANASGDSRMAQAKHQQVKAAYDDAKARSEQAKDALAEVQRIYDDALQKIEQTEGPLERSIEELKGREASLKEGINQLGEDISTARKRRQYCDAVYQYPNETARLRAGVEADERTLAGMTAEADELRERLAQSKQLAKKAKLALGIVALIIVVFIVALVVILMRS